VATVPESQGTGPGAPPERVLVFVPTKSGAGPDAARGGTWVVDQPERNRDRYCDTGDVPPTVPGLRMAMLGELLGVTTWQTHEPGQPESLAPDPVRADIFVR